MICGQAIFLTTLSAYRVVAYSVGKTLTTYQVSFINFVFILMMYVGFNARASQAALACAYADQLSSFRPGTEGVDTTAEVVRIVFTSIRFVLAVGALIFIWQVRHPKTE